MLTNEENALLTRVAPGTPAGELLRRFWHAVAGASELTEAKPKKRVRILGEDLVLFRLSQGENQVNYGLLDEQCSHRGASLYYGFVEPDGIRCPYHGWKYSPNGDCLEQPFEKNPEFKKKICHKAYPVTKLGGILFAYMGPQDRQPLLPRWDILLRKDGVRKLEVYDVLKCNWLQAMENSVDPMHTYYLHGHTLSLKGIRRGEYHYRSVERLEFDVVVEPTWAGIQKRRIFSESAGLVESPHPLIFPNMLLVPGRDGFNMHFRTPIDDTNTQIFHATFRPSGDGSRVEQPEDLPVEFIPTKNEEGDFHMDNFPSQDLMAWETQGPIANRAREHLGDSDRGIILFRKILKDQIKLVQEGKDPVGINRDPEKGKMIRLIPEGYTAFGYQADANEA